MRSRDEASPVKLVTTKSGVLRFEMARRLAFALEKAKRALPAAAAPAIGPTIDLQASHAPGEG